MALKKLLKGMKEKRAKKKKDKDEKRQIKRLIVLN